MIIIWNKTFLSEGGGGVGGWGGVYLKVGGDKELF